MTETEKAIEALEGLTLCGICTGKEEGCKSCDRYNAKVQALKALREQQEREKGCEMCKGRDSLLLRKAHKYCKYCGRRLKEGQADG